MQSCTFLQVIEKDKLKKKVKYLCKTFELNRKLNIYIVVCKEEIVSFYCCYLNQNYNVF